MLETLELDPLTLHHSRDEIYTACLGVEGNGPNFSVHLGAYVALLEHNILPIVSIGGSSGAVTVSVLMALLENQSLDMEYANLTKCQKAALVLAACSCVVESFTFFPTLTQANKTLRSWAQNFFMHHYHDRLVAKADSEVIHVENMVGQLAVAIDFFRETDFSVVIQEDNYLLRCQIMKQLWVKHADVIEITIRDLFKALNHYDQVDCSDKDKVVIDRLVQLLHRDCSRPKKAIKNRVLWQLKPVGLKAYQLMKQMAQNSQLNLVEQILQRKIALFNPEYVWMGYRGFSQTGKFLQIPRGTVIHSTFRKACSLKVKEYPGWHNLYQGYFPAANILPHLLTARSQSSAQMAQAFNLDARDEQKHMVSPDRILILPEVTKHTKRGFSYALQASISETGYFRRYPLRSTEHDHPLNPAMPQMLLSFGGWLEKTPVATIKHLPICQDVDFCITLRRRDSVPWFSRRALRTVLGYRYYQEFPRIAKLMDNFVNYATSLSGCKGNIHAVFDNEWNNPVLQGNENFFLKDLKVGLLPDRQAHMLIGYLELVKILRAQGHPKPKLDLLPWGQPVPLPLIQVGRTANRTAYQVFQQFLSLIRAQ